MIIQTRMFAAVMAFTSCVLTAAAAGQTAAPGHFVAWGGMRFDQAELRASYVQAGFGKSTFTVALQADGTLRTWGNNYYGVATPAAGLSGIAELRTGASHYACILRDGSVVCGGSFNDYGELNVPENLGPVLDIAPGVNHTVALRANGSVLAWGGSAWGQLNVPQDLGPVTAIGAGYYFSAAISGGAVRAWGTNERGECNVPSDIATATAIACGRYHGLCLTLLQDCQKQERGPAPVVRLATQGGVA